MATFNRLFMAIVATLGLLVTVDQAAADPWITLTKCEQSIVDGKPLAHVQFSVTNTGSFSLYTIVMRSPDPNAPQDSCHTVTLDSPPSWPAIRRPDGGAEWNTMFGTNTQLSPGQTLDGFGATLSGRQCCFRFIFFNAFAEPVGDTHFCFHCDLPSPASQETWGHWKAIYR